MTKKNDEQKHRFSRREFLGTGAVAGAATMIPGGRGAEAQESGRAAASASVSPPSPQTMAREVGAAMPPTQVEPAVRRPGSDLMVQVLRDLGIEFVVGNTGSTYEGLQESIINYGDTPNVMPEFITALHEESAVDMCQGYARSEGKPICAAVSGAIGMQHAAMATYQAFLGEAPVIILVGREDLGPRQSQTADDIAGIVRAFTKWDAQPETVEEALHALQEAYRQATTPPCGPVVVVLDSEVQKQEAGDLQVPAFRPATVPTISAADAEHIAAGLVAADNPRLNVGRFRTPEGIKRAIELAELVGASVDTRATSGPMSFPQTHHLSGPGFDERVDYELGLELPGAQASIQGPHLRTLDDRDIIGIGFGTIRDPVLPQRDTSGDFDRVADAEASLPLVIEAVREKLDERARKTVSARTTKHRKVNRDARLAALREAVEVKRAGWEASPISTARVYAELWSLIKDHDWCLASGTIFSGFHNVALWDHDRPYSYLGMYPAAALGYVLGSSTGAALAAKARDRIVINIQGDGDFNYTPGAVWTAAHHKLPMLTIMHNNRAYHMEVMYLQHVAGVRGRGMDRMHIGTTFRDPYIDYAKIAEGYGMKSEGPISDPNELYAALERGVNTVLNGEPYLIDVISQPR
jgi:thiamine pyrophosphate-dependent acetolactate synthase large subunit-like protein